MIICNSKEREQRIFDYVQTLLNISDERNLEILSVNPTKHSFEIIYCVNIESQWCRYEMNLYNSQILLLNSFLK